MALPGIDVSNHQNAVDWPQVASSGVAFAWVKITEGTHYVDPYGTANIAHAQGEGIPAGGYHFARPGDNDADDEAAHFLAHLPGGARLRPVLDLEATKLGRADTVAWAKRWLAAVTLAGHRPILYTYSAFAQSSLDDTLGGWPLWLANYRSTPPRPPAGWDEYVAWQHSSDGNVPGVHGRCDMNLANDLAPLLASGTPPKEDDMTPAEMAAELRNTDSELHKAFVECVELVDIKTHTDEDWKFAKSMIAEAGVEMFWAKVLDEASGWAKKIRAALQGKGG